MTDRLERLEARLTKSLAGFLTRLRSNKNTTTGTDPMTTTETVATVRKPAGVIETHHANDPTEWGYSFTSHNPEPADYVRCYDEANAWKLADRIESAMPQGEPVDVEAITQQRNRLWMLLDDIDTQDDASKGDDAHFRRCAYAIQQKRHAIYSPEWSAPADFNAPYMAVAGSLAQSGDPNWWIESIVDMRNGTLEIKLGNIDPHWAAQQVVSRVIAGVFETGNPKHGWDWLVAKTRIGPHGPPEAAAVARHGGEGGPDVSASLKIGIEFDDGEKPISPPMDQLATCGGSKQESNTGKTGEKAVSDLWNKRREILEKALIKAVLNLFDHTWSNAFELPIPGTSPVLKVAAGEMTAAGMGQITEDRPDLWPAWLQDLVAFQPLPDAAAGVADMGEASRAGWNDRGASYASAPPVADAEALKVGDRVVWTNGFDTELPGKIVDVVPPPARETRFNVALDDGSTVCGATTSRLRRLTGAAHGR